MRKMKSLFKRSRALWMAILSVAVVCTLLLLSQTAFALNTYVITDGDRVVIVTSSATDPAEILNEAGLRLGEDDTYTTLPGIGLSEITIRRSGMSVTIDNRGEILEVNTKHETVGELLAWLNISYGSGITVSEDPGAAVYDGMVLTISGSIHRQQTYTLALPYETTYCNDPSLPMGTEEVITEGRDGQLRCTADVVYENGIEVSRTIMNRTVVEAPVNQIIAVGTGAPATQAGQVIIQDGQIILPTGEILTYTGTMEVEATAYSHFDEGCDMITATMTTVGMGTVAVDPRMIPYGTRMFIISNDGQYIYGIGTAEDCGGAIKGHRVDLYYPTLSECFAFGRRDCTIFFLG